MGIVFSVPIAFIMDLRLIARVSCSVTVTFRRQSSPVTHITYNSLSAFMDRHQSHGLGLAFIVLNYHRFMGFYYTTTWVV